MKKMMTAGFLAAMLCLTGCSTGTVQNSDNSAELEEQSKPMVLRHVSDIIRDVFDVTGFLDFLTIE